MQFLAEREAPCLPPPLPPPRLEDGNKDEGQKEKQDRKRMRGGQREMISLADFGETWTSFFCRCFLCFVFFRLFTTVIFILQPPKGLKLRSLVVFHSRAAISTPPPKRKKAFPQFPPPPSKPPCVGLIEHVCPRINRIPHNELSVPLSPLCLGFTRGSKALIGFSKLMI